MKSFQNFAKTIVEQEQERTKITQRGLQWQIPTEPQSAAPKPIKKPKVIKQSEVSAANKRTEAIRKGYVDQGGRVQERGVVTNRIRASALGYGDAGKDPSRYGINPSKVAAEKGTLFKRATSPLKAERRAARSEIKSAVRSIEKRYPGATQRTDTSFRGFSRGVDYKPTQGDMTTLQRMARPETSPRSAAFLSGQLGTGAGRRAQAAADAAKDIANHEKTSAYHQIGRAHV